MSESQLVFRKREHPALQCVINCVKNIYFIKTEYSLSKNETH